MPVKPRLASGTLSLAAAKSGPFSAMQRGRNPSGSRDHDQLAAGRQQDDVVRPVELLGQAAEDPPPVGHRPLALELVAQRVHEDLGVGVALQVVVALLQQLALQLLVIGELAVEGEGEPLGLAAVLALERLGVAPLGAAAGGVADVADGGGAVVPLHDRLELVPMVEAERLGHRPQLLVGLQERTASGMIAGHPRGELAPVLHVEQHPGDQPGHAVAVPRDRGQRGDRCAVGMEDGRHATLVVQFAHEIGWTQ